MEVTLEQMLQTRETRFFRQMELNQKWGLPIIHFSMNIPGPVKDSGLIRRGFQEGCGVLEYRLPDGVIKHRQIIQEHTGCEAIYVVDLDPIAVKKNHNSHRG